VIAGFHIGIETLGYKIAKCRTKSTRTGNRIARLPGMIKKQLGIDLRIGRNMTPEFATQKLPVQ
jgi:hypothetical protein